MVGRLERWTDFSEMFISLLVVLDSPHLACHSSATTVPCAVVLPLDLPQIPWRQSLPLRPMPANPTPWTWGVGLASSDRSVPTLSEGDERIGRWAEEEWLLVARW